MIADIPTRSRHQAPRPETFGTGHSRRRNRPHRLLSQLKGHGSRIASRRRSLHNIATCFTDQAAMLPLQCEEAIARLCDLRGVAREATEWLSHLDPETTKQLRPYGCIAKLTSLDFWLTQAILAIAMFAPICQEVCYERIELHLYLRSLFPCIRASFEDTISQLAALTRQAQAEVTQ